MTRNELNKLIGLDVYHAERLIRIYGLKPHSIHKNTIIKLTTLPKNEVLLRYDDNYFIVSAETQETIDAKYNH